MGGSFTYKTMGEVIHFDIFLNRVETIQRVQDVLNEKQSLNMMHHIELFTFDCKKSGVF